jgi:thymidylate kinase
MDDLSRQLLYMVDTVNFVSIILNPALEQHRIVLADRSSFVSALVYGMADGLDVSDIDRLFSVITPPKMDRLYVLQCPWDVVQSRVAASRSETGTDGTGKLDHYDSKPSGFVQSISKRYSELVTTNPEQTALIARSVAIPDVVHIDSSKTEEFVAESITDDIIATMHKRCLVG